MGYFFCCACKCFVSHAIWCTFVCCCCCTRCCCGAPATWQDECRRLMDTCLEHCFELYPAHQIFLFLLPKHISIHISLYSHNQVTQKISLLYDIFMPSTRLPLSASHSHCNNNIIIKSRVIPEETYCDIWSGDSLRAPHLSSGWYVMDLSINFASQAGRDSLSL